MLQYLNHRYLLVQAETCAVQLYAKIGLISTITLEGIVSTGRSYMICDFCHFSQAEDLTNEQLPDFRKLSTSIFSSEKVTPLTFFWGMQGMAVSFHRCVCTVLLPIDSYTESEWCILKESLHKFFSPITLFKSQPEKSEHYLIMFGQLTIFTVKRIFTSAKAYFSVFQLFLVSLLSNANKSLTSSSILPPVTGMFPHTQIWSTLSLLCRLNSSSSHTSSHMRCFSPLINFMLPHWSSFSRSMSLMYQGVVQYWVHHYW